MKVTEMRGKLSKLVIPPRAAIQGLQIIPIFTEPVMQLRNFNFNIYLLADFDNEY
jgi:hypothetical protein